VNSTQSFSRWLADVNASNSSGWRPLHEAAEKGQKDVVKLLPANKADVNASDNDGLTPLHLAKGQEDVAELLRQHAGHE